MRQRNYPVWNTQGGGLVREIDGVYIFVERPDCPELDVGDTLPREWDIQPANQAARRQLDDGQHQIELLDNEMFALQHADQHRGCMHCKQSHHETAFCLCGRCFFEALEAGRCEQDETWGTIVSCTCGITSLWD